MPRTQRCPVPSKPSRIVTGALTLAPANLGPSRVSREVSEPSRVSWEIAEPSRVSQEIAEPRCAVVVDRNQEWPGKAWKGSSLSKCLWVACFP